MKFGMFAAISAATAALLVAGNANALTFVSNSSNSGGLLQGSTVLTVNTLSNTEFTFDIKNATDTWTGATGLLAFAFNTNIIGTTGTLSATETSPTSATGTYVPGGLNAGGCDGTGAFFCFSWGPAAVAADMLFDVKTTGTFDYSSTNVPDLKINFVDANGNKVGTLFSADVPFCASCGGTVPEPATWSMLILGTGMIGAVLRKRRRIAFAPI